MNNTITTDKLDWLTDKLSIFGFVSYKPEFRFIKLQDKYYFFFTIDSLEKTDLISVMNENHYKTLNNKISDLFIIGYDNNKFVITKDGNTFKELDDKELSIYFENLNPELTKNVGTSKEINKSQNDSFQIWTRKNLSKYSTINDIDAMYINKNDIVLLELKRPKTQNHMVWNPYPDDIANYIALEDISKLLKCKYYIITYNINDENLVTLHFNLKFNKENKKIQGRKLTIHSDHILKFPFGVTY